MKRNFSKPLSLVLFLGLGLTVRPTAEGQSPSLTDAQSIESSRYTSLLDMVNGCDAVHGDSCTLVVSTPQTITLDAAYVLPPKIKLRFADGGAWTVNGRPLTVGSGSVDGPVERQIFAGTAAIYGLKVARPEWFAPAATVYPAYAFANAYRSTVVWGTVLLNEATYISPFYDDAGGPLVPFTTPRRLLGTKRPRVDDERNPRRLIGGTIILGELYASVALQIAHLGVDVGPDVVQKLYGGRKPNGIFLPNAGGFNPKRGTRLEDVSVLTNNADGQHSVLIEGDEGALIDGLWIWTPGGTHGLVLKSAHSVVRDFHCKGASADCLIVKSDYRTAGNGSATDDLFDGIYISYLARPGDTGGVEMDARWDNVAHIAFENVYEEGVNNGFEADSSWFYGFKDITIDHWMGHGMGAPCARSDNPSGLHIQSAVCTGPQGALPFYAQAAPRPVGARFMDFVRALKPHLRILWVTFCTWLKRLYQWLRLIWHRL